MFSGSKNIFFERKIKIFHAALYFITNLDFLSAIKRIEKKMKFIFMYVENVYKIYTIRVTILSVYMYIVNIHI